MGQCFPVPDNPALKDHMAKVARNWQRIWDMYNIPRETPPGSHMEKAEKLWNKLVVQLAKEKYVLEMLVGAVSTTELCLVCMCFVTPALTAAVHALCCTIKVCSCTTPPPLGCTGRGRTCRSDGAWPAWTQRWLSLPLKALQARYNSVLCFKCVHRAIIIIFVHCFVFDDVAC